MILAFLPCNRILAPDSAGSEPAEDGRMPVVETGGMRCPAGQPRGVEAFPLHAAGFRTNDPARIAQIGTVTRCALKHLGPRQPLAGENAGRAGRAPWKNAPSIATNSPPGRSGCRPAAQS